MRGQRGKEGERRTGKGGGLEIGHEEVHDPFNRSRALHFSRASPVNFCRGWPRNIQGAEIKKARLIGSRLSRDCSKRLSYQYSTSGVVLTVAYAYEATSDSVQAGVRGGTEEPRKRNENIPTSFSNAYGRNSAFPIQRPPRHS